MKQGMKKKAEQNHTIQRGLKEFWKRRELQAMVWPGLLWMAIFSYIQLVFFYERFKKLVQTVSYMPHFIRGRFLVAFC